MNFVDYNDCSVVLAVDLVNTLSVASDEDALRDPGALRAFLEEHEMSHLPDVDHGDLLQVRELRSRLRGLFTSERTDEVVAEINALAAESGAVPQLTDHDGEKLHLHFTPPDAPLAVRLAAEAAMGLAIVVRDHGLERLRTCAAEDCNDVFVDTSRNRSRRYCSAETCGNRTHVAAYRARRRQVAN